MNIGRLEITHRHRAPSLENIWGRFGGGWDWKLGIQASKNFREGIVSLVVCEVRWLVRRK